MIPPRRWPSPLLVLALLLLVYFVAACDDDDPTGGTLDTTAPSPVIDLEVFALTDTSATLRWTAPGDDARQGTAAEYDIRWLRARSRPEGISRPPRG